MWTSRFLHTILRPKCLIIARRTLIKLRPSLDRAIRLPRLLRDIHHHPKSAPLRVPATATHIIGAMSDTGAIAFSIGPGNTGSEFVVRLSSTQKGIWAEKTHRRFRKRTIWAGCNGNSARQTGCSDKMPPEKMPDRIEGISSLPARQQ
jgi:hypothetical protein